MRFLRVLLPLPAFFIGTFLGSLILCIPLWGLLPFFTGQSLFRLLGDIGERGLEGHWVAAPLLVFLLGFFGGIFGYMVGLWAASEKYHAVASWQMLISCLLATGGILSVELVLFAQGRFIPGKAGHAILQASAISAAVVFSHIKGPAGVYEFLKKLG